MTKHETIKIIGIVENCPVTGVKYGPIKVPVTVVNMDKKIDTAKKTFGALREIRAKRTRTNIKHK